MDEDVRRSLREGDLKGAILLARRGCHVEALDLVEAAWLGGSEQARELFFEVLASVPEHARLDHAARLDRLACNGIERAAQVWRDWFPEVARIIGASHGIRRVRAFVYAHARSSAPLVLLGESGVGHAHVAQVLHDLSGRGGFLHVNAAAVTLSMFEHDLRPLGDGATLYVAYLSEPAHEDVAFRFARERNARLIVGATSPEQSRWSPTAHRYAAMIDVPALRQRLDDLPVLCRCLLDRHDGAAFALTAELLQRLAHYDWPGNVRELEHHLWRLVYLARAAGRSTLAGEDLPSFDA